MIAPRRIVIGDVHGHYDGLMHLLEAIAPGRDDSVYFLGDLIDRGPQSARVVEFVRKSPYRCLRGNHEQLLLDAFPHGQIDRPALNAWLWSGGSATVASYPNGHIPQTHLRWMQSLPLYLDLGDIWLVHAGVNPNLPLEAQTMRELCWIRGEFHRSERPYFPDKLIVTGHTITFTLAGIAPGQLACGPGWLDIDTGAYASASGWLTGVDLTHQWVYQVNVFHGETRTLPLEKATTRFEPDRVVTQRQLLQQMIQQR